MRNILFSIFLLWGSMAVGQGLSIHSADSLVVGNANVSHDLESHIIVQNISGSAMDVLVKRIDKNYNALTDSNAICWQVCFEPDVSVSPMSMTLQAGEKSSPGDFSGHVYPDQDGVPHSGDITYVFFNMNDPSDTVAHTIRYEVTTTFDVEEHKPHRLLEIYPNPAVDEVNLRYDLRDYAEARFEVVNVVGNRVYAKDLDTQKNELRLDISKLSRGVYFYTLRSDGKALLTRKLIVE